MQRSGHVSTPGTLRDGVRRHDPPAHQEPVAGACVIDECQPRRRSLEEQVVRAGAHLRMRGSGRIDRDSHHLDRLVHGVFDDAQSGGGVRR